MNELPYGATEKQARRIFNRIGLAFFTMLAVQTLLSSFVLPLLAFAFFPALFETGWFLWAISYIPMYFIGFPLLLLIMRTIPNSPLPALPEPKARITFGGMLKLFFACMGITVGLNLFSTLLSRILEILIGHLATNSLDLLATRGDMLISMLILVIVAPWMEEILFRLLTYNKLIRFGGKTYIFFTATIFALFHLNIYQLFYAFVLGLILAGIMYYTGNIFYCITLHMLVNFFGSVPSLFIQAYGTEEMLGLWGIVMLAMCVIGLIIMVGWLAHNARNIRFAPAQVRLPQGSVIVNAGMPLFLLLMLVLLGINTFYG